MGEGGGANDSGALYGETWLKSTHIAQGFLGFNKGQICIKLEKYPEKQPYSDYYFYKDIPIEKFQLDEKWHYFVFEKKEKLKITVYVDDMENPVDTFEIPSKLNAHSEMTIFLGGQRECCWEQGYPYLNVFQGEYTIVSFWEKILNKEERILSKYGYPRDNYNLSSSYGIYIPHYGRYYTDDYSKNNTHFKISGYNAKILPADDLLVPFGRNVEVFNNVSTSKNINLENNQTGDNFTVIPTKGTAERVIIYESLDSPTNAEDHNLYKDFFGIDIEGASTDFTYNIKYKRKKLTCEDDLSLYMRNYHDGFLWTKLDKATIEKYNIYNIISSSESLSGNKEFIIGYDYN